MNYTGRRVWCWLDRITSYEDDDEDAIIVPTTCPISENDFTELKRRVDPLYACDDYGMGLYLSTLQFVTDHTQFV